MEGANRNLEPVTRKTFQDDQQGAADAWSNITRGGSIVEFIVAKESEYDSEGIVVEFSIRYKDGETFHSAELCRREGDRWTHTIKRTGDGIRERLGHSHLLPKYPLADEFSAVPGTNVSLRLPIGTNYDPTLPGFHHRPLLITFRAEYKPRVDYLEMMVRTEWMWAKLDKPEKKDLSEGGLKRTLYEGIQVEGKSKFARMYLVIGNEREACAVTSLSSTVEREKALALQSLLTARLSPPVP